MEGFDDRGPPPGRPVAITTSSEGSSDTDFTDYGMRRALIRAFNNEDLSYKDREYLRHANELEKHLREQFQTATAELDSIDQEREISEDPDDEERDRLTALYNAEYKVSPSEPFFNAHLS